MTAVTADLTNLPAVNAGETKREYATRLGHAKPGRGRFGANALAVIAAAEAAGGVFSDPAPKPKAPKAAAAPAAPRVTPATVQAALNENKPKVTQIVKDKPAVSQQTADRITPAVMPKRKQTVGYVTERNTLIAFTSCASKGGCGKAVNMCACAGGPKAPHYLDKGVAGTPLSLVKPVV